MKHLLYLIGEPGIGKSSVAAALIGDQPYEDHDQPFYFRRYDSGPVVFGRDREGHPGTDTLPRNVQPKVLSWVEAIQPALVFGEGDRLGNLKFMLAMQDMGYRIWLYNLTGVSVAAARRSARGSHQDPSWIKGRRTATLALMHAIGGQEISATLQPEVLARILGGPVAEAFRNGEHQRTHSQGTGVEGADGSS